MPASIQVQISSKLYLRDPLETQLGRSIVSESIRLIDKLGFDSFTFKKLATHIKSTEASIYRYFKSKLQLLNYLVSWYWSWLDYLIDIRTRNINDPKKKLDIALIVLLESDRDDPVISHVDEAILFKVMIKESARIYLTSHKQTLSSKEAFSGYDLLFEKLLSIILAINPKYKYPRSMTRAIISLAHKLIYDAEFLDDTKAKVMAKPKDRRKVAHEFMQHFIQSSLSSRR